MDKPYKPSEDKDLHKVKVSEKRQREIKQEFSKLLPAVLWSEFLSACAAAYKMRIAQSRNSIAETREDIKKMLRQSQNLRQLFVQAGSLTESYLPYGALHQIDDLIAALSAADKATAAISNTKPSKAYRDELAFKLTGLMDIAGVPIKLARGYSTKGNGDAFYRLMELAVEMVEGNSPNNLRKHMTIGKKLRDKFKKT
jgi:hypothetical protein